MLATILQIGFVVMFAVAVYCMQKYTKLVNDCAYMERANRNKVIVDSHVEKMYLLEDKRDSYKDCLQLSILISLYMLYLA